MTAIYLRVQLPVRSSETTEAGEQPLCSLSCTGWGLHDGRVARPPVRSYRTFPPLPIAWRYLSVALALESPPPAVSWHPCSVVLGLSSSSASQRNPRLSNRLSLRRVFYTIFHVSSITVKAYCYPFITADTVQYMNIRIPFLTNAHLADMIIRYYRERTQFV